MAVNVFEAWDDNDGARLATFLAELSPAFSVVRGNETTRRAFGDVQRIPTVFVFDASGESTLHFIHAQGAKKMTASLAELRAAVGTALRQ